MNTETMTTPEMVVEIERLRLNFPDTQELYREVCVLLFFRHGITPTANKLYQLVRKGSMSAPTEALRAFWADLREKSRVRIEHPDLPEILKAAAGEMVATLWKQAQAAADANFVVFRNDASETVRAAQKSQQITEMENRHFDESLAKANRQVAEAHERTLDLERQLAAERANNDSARNQLEKASHKIETLDLALRDARRDFASELEKQRQALERAQERLQGSEKRALLEIDRERTVANRLQRELDQLRQTLQVATERHQVALGDYQTKMADLLQKLGQAEGIVLAQKEANHETRVQLESAQQQYKGMETRLMASEKEIEAGKEKINGLEAQLKKSRSSDKAHKSSNATPKKVILLNKK